MKHSFVALVVGFLFSIGLGISGMTQPKKVIGFLDIFGSWDPSLAFVMVGAIAVHFVVYRWTQKRSSPLLSLSWHLPDKKEITFSLLAGSFLFGVGWGLAGYCPGPAIVSLVTLEAKLVVFVASMVAGMLVFKVIASKLKIN